MSERIIKVTEGETIRYRGFAQRLTRTKWYRHDTVTVDGKALEGFIQVKERTSGRIESTTCYKGACVLGSDVNWLIRCNEGTANLPTEALQA